MHPEILEAIVKLARQKDFAVNNMQGNLKILKDAISEELKSANRVSEMDTILKEIDRNESDVIQHIHYALHEGKDEVNRYFP